MLAIFEALLRALSARPTLVAQMGALAAGVLLLGLVWRSRGSSREFRTGVAQDGAYILARAFITLPLTIALLGALDAIVARHASHVQIGWFPSQPAWVQLVTYVALMDLVAYGVHRAFHAVPTLWRFHAVHHSQRALNPLTTARIHVVELLVKRVVMWAPLAVLGQPTLTLVWFVVLDGFWGFLVHSGLRLRLGPLRYLLVEPRYHELHHSTHPQHHHANYAERLVLWDLLLRSADFGGFDSDAVPTGIDDDSFPLERQTGLRSAARTYWAQFVYPFRTASPAARPRDTSCSGP